MHTYLCVLGVENVSFLIGILISNINIRRQNKKQNMLLSLRTRGFVNFLVQDTVNFVLYVLSYYRMLNSFSTIRWSWFKLEQINDKLI